MAQELEQNLEANLESSLLKLDEYEGNPLVASESLTDCTVKSAITNQVARLQENAAGKKDILKLLKWPREGML